MATRTSLRGRRCAAGCASLPVIALPEAQANTMASTEVRASRPPASPDMVTASGRVCAWASAIDICPVSQAFHFTPCFCLAAACSHDQALGARSCSAAACVHGQAPSERCYWTSDTQPRFRLGPVVRPRANNCSGPPQCRIGFWLLAFGTSQCCPQVAVCHSGIACSRRSAAQFERNPCYSIAESAAIHYIRVFCGARLQYIQVLQAALLRYTYSLTRSDALHLLSAASYGNSSCVTLVH